MFASWWIYWCLPCKPKHYIWSTEVTDVSWLYAYFVTVPYQQYTLIFSFSALKCQGSVPHRSACLLTFQGLHKGKGFLPIYWIRTGYSAAEMGRHFKMKLTFWRAPVAVITCNFKSLTRQSSLNGVTVISMSNASKMFFEWRISLSNPEHKTNLQFLRASAWSGLEPCSPTAWRCTVGTGLRSMKPLAQAEVDSWSGLKWALAWALFEYEPAVMVLKRTVAWRETAFFMGVRLKTFNDCSQQLLFSLTLWNEGELIHKVMGLTLNGLLNSGIIFRTNSVAERSVNTDAVTLAAGANALYTAKMVERTEWVVHCLSLSLSVSEMERICLQISRHRED